MRTLLLLVLISFTALSLVAQNPAQKIYDTERAFEKMVAERGMKAAFIEYLTPDGIMFFPDAANGRETWKAREASLASLTWNPVLIDVSSNHALAYSISNSIYRPKGKDDTNAFAGHYISIWVRQPSGEYRAVLDTGITHESPLSVSRDWRSPAGYGTEKNQRQLSASDSSTGFYQMAEESGVSKAFKSYLADDAILMRDGMKPFIGKREAIDFISRQKGQFRFAKSKSFLEAADLAYVHSHYTVSDKSGTEIEHGNFVQVWKLRNNKWMIVADIVVPISKKTNQLN